MKMTSNEPQAVSIARQIIPACREMSWRRGNDDFLDSFVARATIDGRPHRVELTVTYLGGVLSLWFTVDRLSWFGLRKTPVADVSSMSGDDEHTTLRQLLRAVISAMTIQAAASAAI
jgi:hypothetical protein